MVRGQIRESGVEQPVQQRQVCAGVAEEVLPAPPAVRVGDEGGDCVGDCECVPVVKQGQGYQGDGAFGSGSLVAVAAGVAAEEDVRAGKGVDEQPKFERGRVQVRGFDDNRRYGQCPCGIDVVATEADGLGHLGAGCVELDLVGDFLVQPEAVDVVKVFD